MPFFETNTGIFVIVLAQCLLVMFCVLASLAFIMYGERKVWGLLQLRRGPNVVGPFGILQSFADLLKHVFKEIIVPTESDKVIFFLFSKERIVWVNRGIFFSGINLPAKQSEYLFFFLVFILRHSSKLIPCLIKVIFLYPFSLRPSLTHFEQAMNSKKNLLKILIRNL